MYSDYYLFFGKPYQINSDSKLFYEEFYNIYRHFRILKEKRKFKTIYLLSGRKNDETGIKLNNILYSIDNPSPRQIALAVPTLISSRLSSHYIFHGGVISHKNKGILICAYSAFGKTTLVLELLKRGFLLLSDELVPISRSTKMIEPFPRAFHISGNTLKLFPELSHIYGKRRKEKDFKKKVMVDIDNLPWGKVGKKCWPKYTVFLSPPGGLKAKNNYIEVAVSYINQGFLKVLRNLKGIKEVSRIGGRDFSLLRLRVDKRLKLMSAIRRLCQSFKIPMIYAHRGKTESINWNVSPTIEPISVSQGVFELAQMLLLSSKSALLGEEFLGSSGKLLTEIAKLFRNMCFYRMIPGKIKLMGEAVEKIVKKC